LTRLLPLLLLAMLAACFPAGQVVPSGPWAGCIASADGTTVDCDWDVPVPERTERAGVPPVVDPAPIGPLDPPVGPRPIPEPKPEPEPEPEPEPHPEPPFGPPGDEPDDDCKPGWGWGDANHCHSGPPGHDRPHPVKGDT